MQSEFSRMTTRWLVVLVITLLIAPSLFAQVELNSAIQGVVKDPQGAVVAGATVELSGSAIMTGKLTTTSDSSGYYRFDNLRPGTYSLSFSKTGVATQKIAVGELAVGRRTNIDATLKVGAASEVVEVTGQAPQIDVSQSKVQTNVTSDVLADVPKGRSFQSVIQFAPGSRAEPLQGGPANGAIGYQIDGATNAENSYMVEGQETASVQYGNAQTNVPMEFTQEIVIKSSGFEAEHGGAIGGIVNVIQKRGSNEWHGSVFTYYEGDGFDSNVTRSLRVNGCGASVNLPSSRMCDFMYIQPKKDHYRIWEPGFEVGGFFIKDKLWAFLSSVPRLERRTRNVFDTFCPPNGDCTAGPPVGYRDFDTNIDTYYSLARLDANPWTKLHLYGTWQYGYTKGQGAAYSSTAGPIPNAPAADDVFCTPPGSTNPLVAGHCATAGGTNVGGGSSNPDSYNFGVGYRQPNLILGLGGDYTPTPALVFSSRWGRVYNNYADRGKPVGIRYFYRETTYPYTADTPGSAGLVPLSGGTTLGAACPTCVHGSGFSNIGDNTSTAFDEYIRSNFAVDGSYFWKHWGTHNFKLGYLYTQLSNDVNTGYNTADVYVAYDFDWTPSFIICDPAIAAFNTATWGAPPGTCRGNWGSANLRELGTIGQAGGTTHALYAQDGWTVGHGLTLNLGVRFDHEVVPSYAPGLPDINFSFGQKIAPRLGASWDVFRNGKLKVYASFGFFYDMMKYDLPRGSFGGDYWHDCGYAMDDPNYVLSLIPVRGADGHYCPKSGPGEGTFTNPFGRPGNGVFMGQEDFRIPSNDPTVSCGPPGIFVSCGDVLRSLFPTKQHELVIGADWQIKPLLALTTRYSRKRLDRTIEDAGIITGGAGEGYAIVNPGFGVHASTCDGEPGGIGGITSCPANPSARRDYDAVEFRLTKAASANWFGQVAYTWSRLQGNYSGLTATDISDGGAGRQGGDVSRAFDEPFMSFDAHGSRDDGPLATDRPHTFKAAGYYRLKWWKMETVLGAFQQLYSGSPLSSYESVWGAPVFVEGRGNWVNMTVDPTTGDFVWGDIQTGKRTPKFSQTDFSIVQEMHVSKNNENLKLGLEANFTNLFNQHSPTFISSNLLNSSTILPIPVNPDFAFDCVNNPAATADYPQLLNGAYNYQDVSNGIGSCLSRRTPNPRYGLPYGWQNPRTIRFKLKFTF